MAASGPRGALRLEAGRLTCLSLNGKEDPAWALHHKPLLASSAHSR